MSSTLDNWNNGNHHMWDNDSQYIDNLLCARSAVSFITGRTEVVEGMTEVTAKTIYMSARNHERMCELLRTCSPPARVSWPGGSWSEAL